MSRLQFLSLIFIVFILFSFKMMYQSTIITPEYPDNWPKPVYDFDKHPLSKEKIELGRRLFYDPVLSRDSTVTCANCHLSYTAFTHTDHALSHGINDSIGTRNSPVLLNLAWNNYFMWDGAVHNIEVQPLAPIHHPAEMDNNITAVVKRLQKTTRYPNWFKTAFGDTSITGERVLKAMAQFQLTLITKNSKYDKVMRGETAFTEQEANGYKLFITHCNSCHTEPLFTNGEFKNNGLSVDSTLLDFGRYNITHNSEDSLTFKVPTLRNIQFSYPYMHDGRFQSLSEAIDHYIHGIETSRTLDSTLINRIQLTSNEKVDLTSFLLTLTDKEFLFNPSYAFPRD